MEKIDDNILSGFIDGTLTPLERLVLGDQIKDSYLSEIVEVTHDVKDMKRYIDKMEPIRIPECERYIKNIEQQELPSTPETIRKNKLF